MWFFSKIMQKLRKKSSTSLNEVPSSLYDINSKEKSENRRLVMTEETKNEEKVEEVKQYPSLTKNFFRGSFKGQLTSVFKTREDKPDKVEDFRKALQNGDCKFEDVLTPQQYKKCLELSIEVSTEFVPPEPTKKKETPVPAEETSAPAE